MVARVLEPTNLYGPNDNYDLANSHVLPALIRKAHEAQLRGDAQRGHAGAAHHQGAVPGALGALATQAVLAQRPAVGVAIVRARGATSGWGGTHLILGGRVNGRRFYGTAPVIANNGPDEVGQGHQSRRPKTVMQLYQVSVGLRLAESADLAPPWTKLNRGPR